MIDPKDISDYQHCNQQVVELEKEIQGLIEGITRAETITTIRPMDYGQRGVYLNILFDEINPSALSGEKMEKLRGLVENYRFIRKTQHDVERRVQAQQAVQKNMFSEVR